eukprot:s972_g26.t1
MRHHEISGIFDIRVFQPFFTVSCASTLAEAELAEFSCESRLWNWRSRVFVCTFEFFDANPWHFNFSKVPKTSGPSKKSGTVLSPESFILKVSRICQDRSKSRCEDVSRCQEMLRLCSVGQGAQAETDRIGLRPLRPEPRGLK